MDKNLEKTSAWVNDMVARAIETEKTSKRPKRIKNI